MKIKKVEVIVPKGNYVIGDPCYAVPDKDWLPLLETCNYFESPIGYVKDGLQKFAVLAFGTKWGDGCYLGSDGHEYPVDAGLLGLVPVELLEDISQHEGIIVNFPKDALCIDDGSGKLRFGHITIDTDPEDPEEEEDEE
jgi:hypothetical protein